MSRKNATAIALVLALAAVSAVYAGMTTTELGAASAATTSPDPQISRRQAQLDRAEAALKRAAKQRPPALPALPARPAAPAAQPQTALPVVRRAATTVVVRGRSGERELEVEHEHGDEAEHHHGGDDDGHGHGSGHDGDDD